MNLSQASQPASKTHCSLLLFISKPRNLAWKADSRARATTKTKSDDASIGCMVIMVLARSLEVEKNTRPWLEELAAVNDSLAKMYVFLRHVITRHPLRLFANRPAPIAEARRRRRRRRRWRVRVQGRPVARPQKSDFTTERAGVRSAKASRGCPCERRRLSHVEQALKRMRTGSVRDRNVGVAEKTHGSQERNRSSLNERSVRLQSTAPNFRRDCVSDYTAPDGRIRILAKANRRDVRYEKRDAFFFRRQARRFRLTRIPVCSLPTWTNTDLRRKNAAPERTLIAELINGRFGESPYTT